MKADRAATGIPAHVLDRTDVREALARHDFGRVFALVKKWAGISYSKIGEACGIKPERVGALARGVGSVTSYEKIAQISDALLIPGWMIGLAPRFWEFFPQHESLHLLADAQRDGGISVHRRDFLKAATVSTGFAVGLRLENGKCRVGSHFPAVLRERTARLRRLDNVLGGGDTFRIYAGEYAATKDLIKDGVYSDATGRELLSVLAEQAQQAGWAAFDAGDHAEAVRLYETSRAAAEQAGEPLLAGNAFAFLAYLRIQADPAVAVQLATASCEVAGVAAVGSAGALLHERRAWAHAIAGNANETARALDDARRALVAGGQEPGPDWSAWVDENELQIMAGRCWTELRRPLRAVPILKTVLADFDDAYARDKALYLSWLADSYLNAGEVEESAATVSRALDLTAGVASVRPRQQLSRALRRLSEYRNVPGVTEMFEKVNA
ncbi:XRE family transcriptional regulator [Actinoplanes flavus]|uniref:XRE family transcriptional regulator n=1 Tax=Actinoplanes flavus TaxID=2820290 RepID=A0ABS3UXF9_9ACTN|nr:XRE family transcriptional regulator [Actinoplanes flavus]MBO3743275.1 XRE family transcriptional regulator [Actinoplanes flavus]